MSRDKISELVISYAPGETRTALIENGKPRELFIERNDQIDLVGNIFRAKISRVVPGLGAAFVDFGAHHHGFLHIDDILPKSTDRKTLTKRAPKAHKDIRHTLTEGQMVIVQILKSSIGNKGARLTMQVSFSTKEIVYFPYENTIRVSHKIKDKVRRRYLVTSLKSALENPQYKVLSGGFIVRSSADHSATIDFSSDLKHLHGLWQKFQDNQRSEEKTQCLHAEATEVYRVIRDLTNGNLTKITTDSQDVIEELSIFCGTLNSSAKIILELYRGNSPIFLKNDIQKTIDYALKRRVDLNNGGYIVIDRTEAMTIIDVNTGGNIGRFDAEDTGYSTNLEAASIIAYHIRLRNLSGIIVIDFIDMKQVHHRAQVLSKLGKELSTDPRYISLSNFTELGLVEINRKRLSKSLAEQLLEDCHNCKASGLVKSLDSISFDVWREFKRVTQPSKSDILMLRASHELIEHLRTLKIYLIEDIEKFSNNKITFKKELSFRRDQFNIVTN